MFARLTTELSTDVGTLVAGQWVAVTGYQVTAAPTGLLHVPSAMRDLVVPVSAIDVPPPPQADMIRPFRIPMQVFADLYLNAPLEVQNRVDTAVGIDRVDRAVRQYDSVLAKAG